MSQFVPVNNAAQFTLQFSQQDGSFAENEFWVQRTGAWSQALLTTMAAAFKTWFGTGDGTRSYKSSMVTTASLQGVGYRDMTTQNGYTGVYQTGLPIAGTDAEAGVSLGVTFSLTARTGLAGRSFRGRTFLVGMGLSQFSSVPNNLVDGTHAGNYVSLFNALPAAVTAADAAATLVVCSRYHQVGGPGSPSVPRAAGITTPILAYGYHDLFADFQRRRAPGHNRHR